MLNRVWIPSPNSSGRGGAHVRLIVLHTAEGALTYQSLGSYFANPASQVSSHVGIDDTPNTVGEYVSRSAKAWTAANANPVAVQAELCAFAAWSSSEWATHPTMLANAAAWVAEEAAAFGIPIAALTPAQAQGGAAGVCQHRDLGTWGGNHSDCGNGFPMQQVIDMARGGHAPEPEPEPEPEVDKMLVRFTWNTGRYVSDLIHFRWIQDHWDDNAISTFGGKVQEAGEVNGLQGFGIPADPTTAELTGLPWPS